MALTVSDKTEEDTLIDSLIEELRPKVLKGAEFLDKNIPDWRKRLEGKHWDISATYGCILVRVTGVEDFGEALRYFLITASQALSMGFDVRSFDSHRYLRYAILNQLWGEIIAG